MYLSRAHTTYNTRTMTGGLTNYRLKYRRRALPTLGKHYTVHCTVDCTLRPHTGSPDGTHRHAASAHRAHALEATRRRSVEEVYTGARWRASAGRGLDPMLHPALARLEGGDHDGARGRHLGEARHHARQQRARPLEPRDVRHHRRGREHPAKMA